VPPGNELGENRDRYLFLADRAEIEPSRALEPREGLVLHAGGAE
jgi:hypothetical protein